MSSAHFMCAKVQRSCEFVSKKGYIWFISFFRAKVAQVKFPPWPGPSFVFQKATGSDKALPEVQKTTMPPVGLGLDASYSWG